MPLPAYLFIVSKMTQAIFIIFVLNANTNGVCVTCRALLSLPSTEENKGEER